MATMSAKDYIKYNDLEGAYNRFCSSRSNWKNHWWETVLTVYHSCSDWAKKYIIDPVSRTLTAIQQKVEKQVRKKCQQVSATLFELGNGVSVEFADNCGEDTNGTEKSYLFKFYEDTNIDPTFSKIGTSARTCFGRLKDEVRYYRDKNGFDITRVRVERIIDCGEMPAEAFESFCRSMFIKKYPGTWKKNDRFFGVDIDPKEFDKLWAMYTNF